MSLFELALIGFIFILTLVQAINLIITKKGKIAGRKIEGEEALIWGWGTLIFILIIVISFIVLN